MIEEFLKELRNSHPDITNIFTEGSCWNLYKILKVIFPEALPYSNVDHIITKIGDKWYDINGEVDDFFNYTLFTKDTVSNYEKKVYEMDRDYYKTLIK